MSTVTESQIRLPAEWEPQDGVLLAWPHVHTDWAPYLDETLAVYRQLVETITRFESVVMVASDPATVHAALGDGIPHERLHVYPVDTQDTWTRDYGPITVRRHGVPRLLDFQFNGWGNKFAADRDNRVTAALHAQGGFGTTPLDPVDLILEGGSIESDGRGTLITTRTCLLHPNRNTAVSHQKLEKALCRYLGVTRILWLEHGSLAGDDTDAHVDTLVRLAPNDTLVYVRCDDPDDEHHAALALMEAELKELRTATDQPYRLMPLPWPQACYDTDGSRLPATYANFLIINGAVLVPVYNDPQDAAALAVLGAAFPDREIVGIDCRTLIRQHGSLHCVTMQLPQGVLS
jgi:agmatine deiminase